MDSSSVEIKIWRVNFDSCFVFVDKFMFASTAVQKLTSERIQGLIGPQKKLDTFCSQMHIINNSYQKESLIVRFSLKLFNSQTCPCKEDYESYFLRPIHQDAITSGNFAQMVLYQTQV